MILSFIDCGYLGQRSQSGDSLHQTGALLETYCTCHLERIRAHLVYHTSKELNLPDICVCYDSDSGQILIVQRSDRLIPHEFAGPPDPWMCLLNAYINDRLYRSNTGAYVLETRPKGTTYVYTATYKLRVFEIPENHLPLQSLQNPFVNDFIQMMLLHFILRRIPTDFHCSHNCASCNCGANSHHRSALHFFGSDEHARPEYCRRCPKETWGQELTWFVMLYTKAARRTIRRQTCLQAAVYPTSKPKDEYQYSKSSNSAERPTLVVSRATRKFTSHITSRHHQQDFLQRSWNLQKRYTEWCL